LVQIISKNEYQYQIDFVNSVNDEELTNLSLNEKNTVCDILIEYGIPVSNENKDDFLWIREEMNKRLANVDLKIPLETI
jgi:hypothetical protein